MSFVRVCPVEPLSGSCPEPMVWREVASTLPLTIDQFNEILPAILVLLATAYGVREVVRLILNRRG